MIVIKIRSNLDDFGIDNVTEIINGIYNNGEISEDLSRSIFIVMQKKTVSNKTPSAIGRIRPKIGQEWGRFAQDTGTRNTFFIVTNYDTAQ